jgi:1,4-alpha-glucan branching enzyme
MTRETLESEIDRIVHANHDDPFSILGMHKQLIDGIEKLVVHAFLPQARKVGVVDSATGALVADLPQVRNEGFFAGPITDGKQAFRYRLRLLPYGGDSTYDIEDPYRFGPVLGELDIHLLVEGTHLRAFEKLGAHVATIDGVAGATFAVWAPNARKVSVVGDFNGWDGRRHPMRCRVECGVWEIFVPGVAAGACYKYEIKDRLGNLLAEKADPFAVESETPPKSASIVPDPTT